MVSSALQICLVYYIVSLLDPYILSWQCINRPIVVAPLAGLVLGDFHTGIVMGAALESIFMGISAIGGSIPADATTASIIAVAYTILTGSTAEAGLAIALPIGTVMASIANMFTPLWASLAAYWEKLAAECNPKKFMIQTMAVNMITPLINTVILFFAVAYGVEGLQSFLVSLPAWVMTGLGASTKYDAGSWICYLNINDLEQRGWLFLLLWLCISCLSWYGNIANRYYRRCYRYYDVLQ